MRSDKPLHIGVCAGLRPHAGRFVITAEYLTGYEILGVYKTAGAAQADLLRVKRAYAAMRARKGGE